MKTPFEHNKRVNKMFKERQSGILLHITSLPSRFGIGDFGPKAYEFADFLSNAEQSFWQILPLSAPADWRNPYHSSSAFAGNPLLISPELLKNDGLLSEGDIEPVPDFPNEIDYQKVISYKKSLLETAFERFKTEKNRNFEKFDSENAYWLDDFALYLALKRHYQEPNWSEWPEEVRDRDSETLDRLKEKFKLVIEREKFFQFTFYRQWLSLKKYCNEKGIRIFGDLPIYLDYNSADVWANQNYFKLNEEKKPKVVSGVPPDAFSDTGQLWGHPIYDWNELKKHDYKWWINRIDHCLNLYDFLRIDHFRGLVAYWEVPAGEDTAINGRWVEGPAEDLFPLLVDKFEDFPFIAEDLGEITENVIEMRDRFGFPGMQVLIFGFGDDFPNNPHLPHNFSENNLACTGTHDTNTIRGWFENEASLEEKDRLRRYLGKEVSSDEVSRDFMRLAMMSVSKLVSTPMQDVLCLGEKARMNRPAEKEGNWKWRLNPEQISPELENEIRKMTHTYGRA